LDFAFARTHDPARFAAFVFVAFNLNEQRHDGLHFGRADEFAIRVDAVPAPILPEVVIVPLHLVVVRREAGALNNDFVPRAAFVGGNASDGCGSCSVRAH
jgi:hypothetical protein